MKQLIKISFTILCLITISCNNEVKFDKALWRKKGDLNSYPYREDMILDLVENYKIEGMSYHQLVELLGEPEIQINSESVMARYNIITEYGNDIDPVYSED